MARHIHVHLHRTGDAGTSEGAKKAALTRKSSSGVKPTNNTAAAHSAAYVYHSKQSGAGHGQAAAMHQVARHHQQNPNPMRTASANAASERAWAASKALGYNPK